MTARRWCIPVILLLSQLATAAQVPASSPQTTLRPYSGKLANDDGQWTMPAKDFANLRYSQLDQINTGNVNQLKVVFTFSTGINRGHEAAPLVVNNTMYIVTPYPNILYALDLTKPGAPVKWSYNPSPVPASQGVACCDVVNRGAVYGNGKIYYNTLDNQTVAIDANTGKEVWKTKLGDIDKGESITMAPLLVKNKVIVGNSGGEFGIRGWLTAVDANTGKIAWRAYGTGPDSDVLIGPNFKPYYDSLKGKDLGVKTWPPDAWKIGGGGAWGFVSYDPDTDQIFYGTANPGPWNTDARPGDNLWTSGVFARNPENGEAHWFVDMTPHDPFDYDGINESLVLDLPIAGQTRKTIVHVDRNGYIYVIDRTNGQILSANSYGYINTTTGVDLKTGRLQYNQEKLPRFGVVVHQMCPAAVGLKDWQPSAFSAKTGLIYIPHQNICMDWENVEANYIAGTPYVGANVKMYPGPGGHGGEFTAWDPVQGKIVWNIREKFPVWSGALATAGNVVFYGTMDGWFKAVDATSGKQLWQYKVGSGIIGQPMTYRGPDGKQYVAVLSGVGGWMGSIVSAGLDASDVTAGNGTAYAVKDLPNYTTRGGILYVFSLP